ncbi:hypothetical protein ACVWY5_001079 [Bradyrhizobium sp. USDA 3256]
MDSIAFLTFSTRSSGPPKRPIPLQRRTSRREPLPDLGRARRLYARGHTRRRAERPDTQRPHEREEGKTFLHRGISARNFKRQFTLADYVEVKGARFENGLLVIDLQREISEAMKPRRIAMNGAAASKVAQIEAKAA